LTWILGPIDGSKFSFVDAISLVHDSEDWKEEALPLVAEIMAESRRSIETVSGRREFWFLPTVRTLDQLFHLPVKPEQLVRARGRKWILGDFLFALSNKMGFDAALIDMRAGVTEFSSPFLLDPRVQKILVTSCNQQSVEGTLEILRRVRAVDSMAPKPEVVITLVPPDLTEVFQNVSTQILDVLTDQDPDGVTSTDEKVGIHRVDFAQELLHFEDLDDLALKKLSGNSLGKVVVPSLVDRLITRSFDIEPHTLTKAFQDGTIPTTTIATAAESLEFAEQNDQRGLLPIPALKNLLTLPAGRLPVSVVLGSKGAGKTFVWGQLVLAGTLREFASLVGLSGVVRDAQIFPLLSPASMGGKLEARVAKLESQALGARTPERSRLEVRAQLESASGVDDALEFWLRTIAARLGRPSPVGTSLRERVISTFSGIGPFIFVVDGLEEAFQVAAGRGLTDIQRRLLRALLQDLPNALRETNMEDVGLVVFVRRDLAAAAIIQNFGQFESLHRRTSLTWTPADALRLPVWLLSRLEWHLPVGDIETASYEELSHALVQFWGEKMGGKRDAFTDEWVIATLSDFNLVLQARDMIRLIRYATKNHAPKPLPLHHQSLRDALTEVSSLKIDELGKEIGNLKEIFQRLRETQSHQKVVPFAPQDVGLSPDEVIFLQELGLLSPSTGVDKLFMPEIIRHGLGFGLANRGRARVLALYREARQRRLL
jgi:hypothetical protein